MTTTPPDVKSIFGRALEIESLAARAAYLEEACGTDADLRAETIDRVCARQRLCLQNGMTSRDLARCIQIAIRGFNDLRLNASTLGELDRMIRLLVAGAVAPAGSEVSSKRLTPPSSPRRAVLGRTAPSSPMACEVIWILTWAAAVPTPTSPAAAAGADPVWGAATPTAIRAATFDCFSSDRARRRPITST